MTTGPTLLVVDSVPIFRELGTVFLSRYGRVLTAASSEEALELVREERPDVAVVDLHLPDRDGASLCRQIRREESGSPTPVILMGSRSAQEHAIAVRAGASDVLSKPLARSTLVEAAIRFLHREGPRGLPRVEVRAPVRVAVGGGVRWATLRNVSRGGVFIEADWQLPEQAELGLEFTLPELEPPMTPTALVMWNRSEARGSGMGVRFLELEKEAASHLDQFVYERFVPAAAHRVAAGASA